MKFIQGSNLEKLDISRQNLKKDEGTEENDRLKGAPEMLRLDPNKPNPEVGEFLNLQQIPHESFERKRVLV